MAEPSSKNKVNGNGSNVGLLVPLYCEPNATWRRLAQIKQERPSVEIVVIINPCNGPGYAASSQYVEGVRFLKSRGVVVIGYIHTKYGSRNLTIIKSEIDSYKNWYLLDGIFLDEMANKPGKETYYSYLTKHAKLQGMTLVCGNPGTDAACGYAGTVDNLILYDNNGMPVPGTFEKWTQNFGRNNFSFLSYGVDSLDMSLLNTFSKNVRFFYVTDRGPENPWDSLPSYLDELLGVFDLKEFYVSEVDRSQN